MMPDTRPIIGITMGDPAGVGAEVTVKSFDRDELHDRCRALVFGDAVRLREACEIVDPAAGRGHHPNVGQADDCRPGALPRRSGEEREDEGGRSLGRDDRAPAERAPGEESGHPLVDGEGPAL